MKVVINCSYGGFGLSHKAIMEYSRIKNIKLYPYVYARNGKGFLDLDSYLREASKNYYDYDVTVIHYSKRPVEDGIPDEGDQFYFSEHDIIRDDPVLVEVVERLGKDATKDFSELKIINVPDDVKWEIHSNQGREYILTLSKEEKSK